MVRAAEGDLVELGGAQVRREGRHRRGEGGSIGEIRHYVATWARKKGKTEKEAENYAAYLFRDMFKAWPNHPRIRYAALRSTSVKTLNFITSRQIAFAKARERAAHG